MTIKLSINSVPKLWLECIHESHIPFKYTYCLVFREAKKVFGTFSALWIYNALIYHNACLLLWLPFDQDCKVKSCLGNKTHWQVRSLNHNYKITCFNFFFFFYTYKGHLTWQLLCFPDDSCLRLNWLANNTCPPWTVPQLSILAIYNGIWSIFIQWSRALLIRCCLINTKESLFCVCDNLMPRTKEKHKRGGDRSFAELCSIRHGR